MFYKKDKLDWLEALARRWGLADALSKQQAVFAWRKAVGPQLARWARPLYVARGVLHLAVGSYAAASQLRLLERKLVESLTEVAPDCGVKALRLHVQPEREPAQAAGSVRVGTSDTEAAERIVPSDLDPALRQRLVYAAAQAHAQERAILEAGGSRCAACGAAFLGTGSVCPLCSLVGGDWRD